MDNKKLAKMLILTVIIIAGLTLWYISQSYDDAPKDRIGDVKTLAVEVGTGRIASEYNLTTENAILEDHLFLYTSSGWIDMGIGGLNNES